MPASRSARGQRTPVCYVVRMRESNATNADAWTIQRLLEWTRGHFVSRAVDEPRLAAEILLAKALGCRRIDLYAWFDRVPKPSQLAVFRDFVKRAADHVPISYLVGTKEFYSLEFEVSPAVLIPRPETETLVQQAIETVRASGRKDAVLLDWCTGSGCIAIALLHNLPGLKIVASDVSEDALVIAARNAKKHAVADRLSLVRADRLQLPQSCIPTRGFDAIVSNPPYVAAAELDQLDANVRDHEPGDALTDGDDGFSFYRCLAVEGGKLVSDDGRILVEVADRGADTVRELLSAGGVFVADGAWRDAVGGHERVLRFRRAGTTAS